MPYCGLGADKMMEQFAGDPFGKWKTMTACIKEIMKENPDYTKEQAAATCAEIEKKSKAKKDIFQEALEVMRDGIDAVLSKLDVIEDAGKPKSEAERAMAHFKISKEKWEKMSKKEKAKKISELPERGEGLKKDEGETIIDKAMSDEDLGGLLEFYGLSQANWDAYPEEVHTLFKSLYAEQKKPDEDSEIIDALDDCLDCEDDEEEIKRLATDLSLEDIDKKLKELKTARERLREQVRVLDEKLYQEPDSEKKRKTKIREERGELWDRLDDLYDEIRAYTQAKTMKITQSALIDSGEQDNGDGESETSETLETKETREIDTDKLLARSRKAIKKMTHPF